MVVKLKKNYNYIINMLKNFTILAIILCIIYFSQSFTIKDFHFSTYFEDNWKNKPIYLENWMRESIYDNKDVTHPVFPQNWNF